MAAAAAAAATVAHDVPWDGGVGGGAAGGATSHASFTARSSGMGYYVRFRVARVNLAERGGRMRERDTS